MDPEFTLDSETEKAAGDIISQMPDVQEHAIAAAEAERGTDTPPAASAEGGENVDVNGVAFNPDIHTGSKLKSGAWRERKNKGTTATPKAKSVVAGKTSSAAGGIPAGPSQEEINARAAGAAAAGALVTVGMMIGGEEWQPITEPVNEMEQLSNAFGNYFVAKGVNDFPPGVALSMAICMYALPRFTQPKTQTRVRSLKNWLVLRAAKWKVKRELKKRGVHAEVSISDGQLLINGKTRAEFNAAAK
jgi:hypothetical protein